jgi:hypothetical protein
VGQIKLIIHGIEQKNISQDALKWFYNRVLNGDPGPFECVVADKKNNAILLNEGTDMFYQLELL